MSPARACRTTSAQVRRRASRPVGRVLCTRSKAGRRPSIWDCRCRQPRAVYPRASGGPPSTARAVAAPRRARLPFDLAPGGVYRAAAVTCGAGGLLHHRQRRSDLQKPTAAPTLLRVLSAALAPSALVQSLPDHSLVRTVTATPPPRPTWHRCRSAAAVTSAKEHPEAARSKTRSQMRSHRPTPVGSSARAPGRHRGHESGADQRAPRPGGRWPKPPLSGAERSICPNRFLIGAKPSCGGLRGTTVHGSGKGCCACP